MALRVALIGCGSFGRTLADLIQQVRGYQIVGVCDSSVSLAQALGEELNVPYWTDVNELLIECPAMAVTVQTPHHTHRDIVIAAAEAKRHIFCEKTMAVSAGDCRAMIEAADRNRVKLMVGHKRRLRPAFAKLKAILDSGVLGQPIAVNVSGYFWRELTGWWTRNDEVGGLQYWAGTHDFDTLRFLFGDIASVHAMAGPKINDKTDYPDAIAAIFRFRSGVIGSFQVSTFFPQATYRTSFSYQIVCERGGLLYDPTAIAVEYQLHHQAPVRFSWPDYGHETAYRAELESFHDWVMHDAPPVLTGWDGLRVVEVLEAMNRSMQEDRPIELPPTSQP